MWHRELVAQRGKNFRWKCLSTYLSYNIRDRRRRETSLLHLHAPESARAPCISGVSWYMRDKANFVLSGDFVCHQAVTSSALSGAGARRYIGIAEVLVILSNVVHGRNMSVGRALISIVRMKCKLLPMTILKAKAETNN